MTCLSEYPDLNGSDRNGSPHRHQSEPFTFSERAFIMLMREKLAHQEPSPSSWWVAETIGLINGTLRRRWVPNPHMMRSKDEPVGHWETVSNDR